VRPARQQNRFGINFELFFEAARRSRAIPQRGQNRKLLPPATQCRNINLCPESNDDLSTTSQRRERGDNIRLGTADRHGGEYAMSVLGRPQWPLTIANGLVTDANAANVITMAVTRVIRSRDRRWRIEIRNNRKADLYDSGLLILRQVSLERIGQRLAEAGVNADDLLED
jgi:hypothetical protein